jgi:hypothetical protein
VPKVVLLTILAITALSLRAQPAPAVPTSAPSAAGQAWVAPEKTVQLQHKRPWIPRPDVAGTNVGLYGLDLTVPSPVFTVNEASKRCSWLYNLAVPIDVNKYPIAVLRYRAKNISRNSVYTLRVDSGTAAPGVCRVFGGNELQADGEIHEAKRDLRDFKVTEPIALIGIGVESTNDLPATLELIDIRFDAPDDAPVESPDDDNAIAVKVTDDKDNPIRGARVMIDLERRNFVRTGNTDASGDVSIVSKKNESDTHMLAVNAAGFNQVEVLKVSGGETVTVKLTPSKPYGGVAKVNGKPVAGAMVFATVKGDPAEGTQELRSYSTITDSAGRWLTPPLPADVEQISLSLSHTDGTSVAKIDLDASEAQASADEVRRDLLMARAKAQDVVQQVAPAEAARDLAKVRAMLKNGAPVGVATADHMPAAEKSIVLQLGREWTPHPDWGGADEANLYGVTFAGGHPTFSTREPGKSCVFTYPLALPIDPARYPFVVMRYRATNLNATEHYTLRVESGAGQGRNIMRFGGGDEVKADGEIHELKRDMREAGAAEPISQVCVALQCGEQAPAALEVLELRFDAADGATNAAPDDKAIEFLVTDQNDKPVPNAFVSVDYERRNWARTDSTKGTGKLTVTPRKNESGKHSVMVTAKDFVQEEVRDVGGDNGPVTIKLTPGAFYADVANVNGKPIAGAMVLARVKAQPEEGHRWLPSYATITDEKGRWALPMAITADASQVTLTLVQLLEGEAKPVELVAAEAQAHAPDVLRELAQASAGHSTVALATSPPRPATKPAAPAKVSVTANEPLPAPEKAIVLDVHRPWLAGPMWDGNEPPKAYGENLDLPQPRFTVVDANAKGFWVYKPLWPIDLSRYPILKIKYRAKNTSASNGYVLRLVEGNVQQILKSEELVADGELHEYVKDLREVNAERKLTNIGIWVNAGEKGNATFDLAALAFYAPDDAPAEALGKLSPQPFVIKGPNDQPIVGAKVTIDAERANFAQSGTTDSGGKVSVTPLTQWVNVHSVRVEKDGMYPIERKLPDLDQSPIEIELVPGSRYGGIARGAENSILANAMIIAAGSNDLDAQTQMPARSTVLSDSQGRWVTPVLPAVDGLSISITPPAGGSPIDVDLARAKSDGADLWEQLRKAMAIASAPNPPIVHGTAPAPTADRDKGNSRDSSAAGAVANIDATILKVDESSVGGKILSMDGKQLTMKTDKESKSIPLADVQEITLKPGGSNSSNSNDSSSSKSGLGQARIELANNDHFKGAIKKWEEKKLAIALAAAPSVTVDVPIDQARQLWLGTPDQVKKAQALNEKPGVEDIAFVAKDDQIIAVRGISLGIDGESLKFRFNDQERKIAVNRLAGLTFGRSEDAPVDRAFHQAFQFSNDDVITGNWTGLTKDSATATTLWGDEMKLPVKQLARIRAANGRVVYLSDLKPTQVEQVPYFDRMLTYRVDKALNGKPLQLTEGAVAKGIAVHSRTVLHYDLGGQFDEFRCKLGFQQPEGKLGQADVRVLGDGKAIFEKADAKGDQPSADVNVKVGGVKELVLEVDFGKNQDVGDRVVWGNARLLRAQLPQQTNAAPVR